MDIPSPFEGLHLDRDLVCEFFAVFSRFEFSLKEAGFYRNNRGLIEPAWWGYAEKAEKLVVIKPDSPLDKAVNYLCDVPPMFQVDALHWERRDLHGASRFGQAIDAAKQVRNNLFHGGKHTPHSEPGRDDQLVTSSLTVLYACLQADKQVREIYMQNVF